MNRERILKVADRIADLPYAQVVWASLEKPKSFNMASGCGSACCIGAWTGEVCSGRYETLEQARETLGLNHSQAQALFRPPEYTRMKADGRTAAQVLRKMAAAGGNATGARIRKFWRESWA